MESEILISKHGDLDKVVKNILFRKIGQGLYINRKEFEDKSKTYFIGAHCPQLLEDTKENRRVIKFLEFPDIFSLSVVEEKSKWKIDIPPRNEIAERIEKQVSNLVFTVEQSLLKASYGNLIDIPTIQTSINPISEILNSLYQRAKLDADILFEIEKSRGARTKKYLHLLESLEIIRKNKESQEYTFGNRFIQIEKTLEKADKKRLFKQILSIVIKEGYSYLTECLNLMSITPFLRWSNSYYFPSHQMDNLLHMKRDDIYTYYRQVYPNVGRPKKIKFENQLSQIIGVNILREEEGYIIGSETIYSALQ